MKIPNTTEVPLLWETCRHILQSNTVVDTNLKQLQKTFWYQQDMLVELPATLKMRIIYSPIIEFRSQSLKLRFEEF